MFLARMSRFYKDFLKLNLEPVGYLEGFEFNI